MIHRRPARYPAEDPAGLDQTLHGLWGVGRAPQPSDMMSTGPGLGAPGLAKGPQASGPVGLQTLLDLLVGVYQEFYSSTLAKEKYVSGFLQWGECFPPRLQFLIEKTSLFGFLSRRNADVFLRSHTEMQFKLRHQVTTALLRFKNRAANTGCVLRKACLPVNSIHTG